jgi:hypothetical protein
METITDERPLASAVNFLKEGGETEAALLLLDCDATVSETKYDEYGRAFVFVYLIGPRRAYDAISDLENEVGQQVRRAFEAVLPEDEISVTIRAPLVEVDLDWREQSRKQARDETGMNQAPFVPNPVIWNNLRFHSATEARVARALERTGVMFFPNCLGRVGTKNRRNRAPDFLVCSAGKWGILEVDGAPFHPATRASEDHERDRHFKEHGARVVERFDATRCYQDPDGVAADFLAILNQS